MLTIEYGVVKNSRRAIHLARPKSDGAMDGQQVVAFSRSEEVALLCLATRHAYEAVAQCVNLALGFGGAVPVSAEVALAGSDQQDSVTYERDGTIVTLERSSKNGARVNFLRISSQQRVTVANDEDDAEIDADSGDFSLRLTDSELKSFSTLFAQLTDVKFDPILSSKVDTWFLPTVLTAIHDEAKTTTSDALEAVVEHLSDALPHPFFEVCCEYFFSFMSEDSIDSGKDLELEPWLVRTLEYRREDIEMATSFFYTAGKDAAFAWMAKNPTTTQTELVDILLKEPGKLPAELARQTAEKVAARVFLVRENRA